MGLWTALDHFRTFQRQIEEGSETEGANGIFGPNVLFQSLSSVRLPHIMRSDVDRMLGEPSDVFDPKWEIKTAVDGGVYSMGIDWHIIDQYARATCSEDDWPCRVKVQLNHLDLFCDAGDRAKLLGFCAAKLFEMREENKGSALMRRLEMEHLDRVHTAFAVGTLIHAE